MNKRQAGRLLNIALALREYAHPERFDMGCYVHTEDNIEDQERLHWCGTPGCALGTYASRGDLQRILRVVMFTREDGKKSPAMVLASKPKELADFSDNEVLDHFGITDAESRELFNYDGCGSAETPIEAATYIEEFVARKLLDQEDYGSVLKRAMGYTPYGQ